jgi:predicted MPP superfamily phosphohydrolase
LKNLPSGFNGMTIAQISDIHSGSFFNKTAVRGGVDMLLQQKPDIIFSPAIWSIAMPRK